MNNDALFIACQVAPSLAWGGTGVGKTTVLLALARALGRRGHLLIGATHLPEDFSGYPDADREAGVTRMLPPSWVEEMMDGLGFLILDELTCVSDVMLAAELAVITERRVGERVLPPSTIIVGAANPPHLAPGGRSLPPSMRSRFYHHQWVVDREELFKGFRNGLEWGVPKFPKVEASHKELYPKYGSLVESFLRGNGDCMERVPDSDEQLSFPNPRTWSYVVKTLSAAESVGHTRKSPIFRQLVRGCVGDAAGSEFVAYLDRIDLIDPESVLSGQVRYEYSNRPDVNLCLLTGLVRELRAKTDGQRWANALAAFLEVGERDIELFLTQWKSLWAPVSNGGVRPDGVLPPSDIMKRIVNLTGSQK